MGTNDASHFYTGGSGMCMGEGQVQAGLLTRGLVVVSHCLRPKEGSLRTCTREVKVNDKCLDAVDATTLTPVLRQGHVRVRTCHSCSHTFGKSRTHSPTRRSILSRTHPYSCNYPIMRTTFLHSLAGSFTH